MAAVELVGVYDADGGLLGEAAYVVGRLCGTRHCALCDITHSAVRRRRRAVRTCLATPSGFASDSPNILFTDKELAIVTRDQEVHAA